ncbi:MAG: nitroreductase/quinone reductase family protein [Acidimicrobiia bacterium]|nr:nitroreductase/quinone reductase family protein [Acidimicrobiia bacterium]
MEPALDELARFTTIDLTTIGRTTGLLRRIEIWWFRVDGRFIITGTPGFRDWYANVLANPAVVIHVDGRALPATVRPVRDPGVRLRVFTHPDTNWYTTQASLDDLVATSPMVEVRFDD